VIAGNRTPPVEVLELRYPVLVERRELAADSGGAGQHRGGLGINTEIRALQDMNLIGQLERTKHPSWGLLGGSSGRPNQLIVHFPDGRELARGRFTTSIPKDTVVELRTGGGGGYGEPAQRDPADVRADLEAGYMTEAAARRDYPHAFVGAAGEHLEARANR
jgi:N-methylhydantoinase B